jgi:hypothetical protein
MYDIAQKQILFLKKLPELDPDPDLVMKLPDPAKRSGSVWIRIRNTGDNAHANLSRGYRFSGSSSRVLRKTIWQIFFMYQ